MYIKKFFIILFVSLIFVGCGVNDITDPFSDSISGNTIDATNNTPETVAFQYVEGGQFQMGNIWVEETTGTSLDEEKPVHNVSLFSFYMGKYEVTNGEFVKFLRDKNVDSKGKIHGRLIYESENRWATDIIYIDGIYKVKIGKENFPAGYMSWEGAVLYCNWVSEKNGLEPCYDSFTFSCDFNKNGYRLPTEAEWEYAASVKNDIEPDDNGIKSKMKFPWGNEEPTDSKCNMGSDFTKQVGSYPAYNGLFDMAGNVTEWCFDKKGTYPSEAVSNPTTYGTESYNVYRVVRGGKYSQIIPQDFMTTRRIGQWDQKSGFMGYGFRLSHTMESN